MSRPGEVPQKGKYNALSADASFCRIFLDFIVLVPATCVYWVVGAGRAFYSAPSTAPAPIMTRLRWRVPRRLPSQKVLVVHSKVPQHPAHIIAKLKAPGLSVSRWHFPKMLLPWRCTARTTRI